MSLVWHIVRKDLFRLRIFLLLWAAILNGRMVFALLQSHLDPAAAMGFIAPAWIFGLLFLPPLGFGLVMGVLADDSVCDSDAFWITRPIAGRQLLCAKLIVLGLLSLFPAVLMLPWWGALGYNAAQLAAAFVHLTKWQFVITVLAVPVAALSPSIARFVVNLALVASAFLALLMMHDEVVESHPLVNPSCALCLRLVFGLWLMATAAILLNQFQTRRTRRSLSIGGAALVLGFGLTAFIGTHASRFVVEQDLGSPAPVFVTSRVLAMVPPLTGAHSARDGTDLKVIEVIPNDPRGVVFTVSESVPDLSDPKFLRAVPAPPAYRYESYFLVHRQDGRAVVGRATTVGEKLTAATVAYSHRELVFSLPRDWTVSPAFEFRRWAEGADLVKVGADTELGAYPAALAGPNPREAELMDRYAQLFTDKPQFMGSVLVARGDKVVLSKGYGWADQETHTPNTPATKFRIGSVTKQFTAAAILLLEERGKLQVNDPIKKYLPDAPAAWERITIHHLLTHTAGIPNYTNLPEYQIYQGTALTPEQLVGKFRDLPLEFTPGTNWKYSNSHYAVLGYLIERISGQSYGEFLQANIFRPLGMKDSGFDGPNPPPPGLAVGYRRKANEWVKARFVDMSVPFAAGGIYSTTEDLLRWERGLFGGKLLSPASLEKMTTPVEHDYAYGLGTGTQNGHKVINHNGAIDGFYSHLAYYPDDRLVVTVLGDVEGPGTAIVGQKVTAIAQGAKLELPGDHTAVPVAPEILRQYVGTYQLKDKTLFITLDGDHLIARGSNIPATELFAESETRFFTKVSTAVIEFGKDSQGQVTHFTARENGGEVIVHRISATVEGADTTPLHP